MEKAAVIMRFLLLILVAFLLATGSGLAEVRALAPESRACLSCHMRHNNVITFENGETLEAHVDEEKFSASIHHNLACTECHPDFRQGQHPQRHFRSKEQYLIKASLVCRRCHREEQIKAKNIHATLLGESRHGTTVVCTNCHGAHTVRRLTGAGRFVSEEEYCLKCHSHDISLPYRNGQKVTAIVDESTLQKSVHAQLACSDCHYGFSPEEHPRRNFDTPRDYTLASSENCRRCHFDKYAKTLESIHYAMLAQGNQKAPVCVDCHGAHNVMNTGKDRQLVAKRCQKCHPDTYEIYAKSVHGSALVSENNQGVPVCADCHTAHIIENPFSQSFQERIPEICSNCHANEAVVGKYGLSTAVVDNYLSNFHGVTLQFYRKQKEILNKPARPMAVCTDCHGTHNIASTNGPDASVMKANLRSRCRKCHANAPENFPDAWLSHYKPSFERAPLVYLANLAYRVFIPILIVGLILQIILHIWRYAANR